MAWRCYKYPSNDLWQMLFQYSIKRTDVVTTKIHLLKFNAMHMRLLHDLATIVTLVPGP